MLEGLSASGLRRTKQREAVVRAFAGDDTHPTAQELYDRLRPSQPSLSFATVYNTLDALAHAGLTHVLRIGNAARFDPDVSPHHHAVCSQCHLIVDLPAGGEDAVLAPPAVSLPGAPGGPPPGFRVVRVERIYRGLCGPCSAR